MEYQAQQPKQAQQLVERAWNLPRRELLEEAAPAFRYIVHDGKRIFDFRAWRFTGFNPQPTVPVPKTADPYNAQSLTPSAELESLAARAFRKFKPLAKSQICREWKYCEQTKKYGRGIMLALNLLPLMQALWTSFNVVGAIIAFIVHLIKDQLLEPLCGCVEAT